MHDAIFYCVANMPGAVANTSTNALTNVTLPYAIALADKGWKNALRSDHVLARGLNTHEAASPTPRSPRPTAWNTPRSPTSSPENSRLGLNLRCAHLCSYG